MKEDAKRNAGWLDFLSEEDLAFLKRFLLASGSLKEVAKGYGISYPTVRLRLDRLIAKVEVVESAQGEDEYERTLRAMYADGRFDAATLRQLLDAYHTQDEGAKE